MPAANNGMHPTANTNLLIFLQGLGATGDAGVSWLHENE